MRIQFIVCVCVVAAASSAAYADDSHPLNPIEARNDRLRGLNQAELALLEPHLARGPVALVEFADMDRDQLPGINVATYVRTPAAKLAALVAKPEGYPAFMRTLDNLKVLGRHGRMSVYKWRWQLALFELSGKHMLTAYPARPDRPDAGHRFTIRSTQGDLGTGRILIRVLPRGAHKSLLIVSLRMDLRRANYIAQQIARASRSINRAANMALAYTMVLSFRREAERRVGLQPDTARHSPLRKPQIDARITKMLRRGDLVFLDMHGDRVQQVATLGQVHKPLEQVRGLMLDADKFGASLVPGSSAEVEAKREGMTRFRWAIDLPLIGVSGRMQLSERGKAIAIEAVSGALDGGRWYFEPSALSKHATLVLGWARFDLRKSTWLVKRLLAADPYLGHGMTAASEVMLMRALRSRARKL